MGKVAFVFSGQGDQFPGMGKDLADTYSSAKAIYELCDQIRPGTSAQSFEGTEEELKQTANTQPCLFAYELAAVEILKEKGIVPDMLAGFSLGEVVAATVSGAFSYEEGFRLVCKRGELMQQAAESYDTAMVAVVKLSNSQVEELCSQFENMYPVNYNCPGQVSVSGASENMAAFSAAVKAAGGRAIPVKVKGAFHSPYMKSAAQEFEHLLKSADIKAIEISLYSNKTSKLYGDNFCSTLGQQICSPVRWEACIREMIAAGADRFIEIGPGKTLTNMIKKIDSSVELIAVSDLLTKEASC